VDASISFRELDLLVGEVLPQRALLSTISDVMGGGVISGVAPNVIPGDGGGLGMDSARAAVDTLDHLAAPVHPGGTGPVSDVPQATPTGHGAGVQPEWAAPSAPSQQPVPTTDDGSSVYYACQSTYSPGTPGVLGSAGVGSSPPTATQTCTPAAVVASDGGEDDGSTVYYACQSTYSPGTPGVLGSAGVGSSPPSATQTCTPAAVTTG